MTRFQTFLTSAGISIITAMPLGGFIFGFAIGEGTSEGFEQLFGRILLGIVFAFLTPLSGGFPPRDEAGIGPPFNAWPCIIGTAIVTSVLLYLFLRSQAQPKSDEMHKAPKGNTGDHDESVA